MFLNGSSMSADAPRIGYVLKRYPRYSETFVVNEILAHEAAGLPIEIFALRPSNDTHFQDILARVRAPVRYLPFEGLRAATFWSAIDEASETLPGLWSGLKLAHGEDSRDVYQAVLLAQMAQQHGIAHLHAHFASMATTVARLAAHFAGITYSFTAHAKDIFHESVNPADLRQKLSDAATVITVSDFNLDYLRDTYGLAAERVQRVYNGLDLERFPYRAPDERPPVIISVGRLVEKKGFDVLIDACAHLAAQGRMFECQIVGTGELEAELHAQIERLGLHQYVRMLGARPQRDLIDLVQQAAVFAAPCVVGSDSNADGLPTVLLEAMALGTPCVSTDVTGIPEVVRHGVTGLQVAQHDSQGLAQELARLLDDAELRVTLARAARRQIEQSFDIHQNAAQIRNLAFSLALEVA
jgi:colanic acid/amylovoran biosynthesis glycosyltransferase